MWNLKPAQWTFSTYQFPLVCLELWMTLLPRHGLVTWCIGSCGNYWFTKLYGSSERWHISIYKKKHIKNCICWCHYSTYQKVFEKPSSSQWQTQVSPDSNFYLMTCILSLATVYHLCSLMWQAQFIFKKMPARYSVLSIQMLNNHSSSVSCSMKKLASLAHNSDGCISASPGDGLTLCIPQNVYIYLPFCHTDC